MPALKLEPMAGIEGAVLDVLNEAYPFWVSGKFLMETVGLLPGADPVSPFVAFLNFIIRINAFLASFGWQAVRTGGTVDDHYRLSPIGAG
ncbi:hypothetical protein G6K93_07590 [Agrobacterium rhizogenes]|nr:hypothetical protein [Rhizobium rhizogenes]